MSDKQTRRALGQTRKTQSRKRKSGEDTRSDRKQPKEDEDGEKDMEIETRSETELIEPCQENDEDLIPYVI